MDKICMKCNEPATHYYGNHKQVCFAHAVELYELPTEHEFKGPGGVAIPQTLMRPLHRYIIDRCPTGDFLRAVLSNNLLESCGRADHISIKALPSIVSFIYNHAPGNCHGSPEKVRAWLNPSTTSEE